MSAHCTCSSDRHADGASQAVRSSSAPLHLLAAGRINTTGVSLRPAYFAHLHPRVAAVFTRAGKDPALR